MGGHIPQALHIVFPVSSRLQSGVIVVPQFWQATTTVVLDDVGSGLLGPTGVGEGEWCGWGCNDDGGIGDDEWACEQGEAPTVSWAVLDSLLL